MKKFCYLFVLALLALGFGLVVAGCSNSLITKDYSDCYKKTKVDATCLKITQVANVRSEPIALSDGDGDNNSYGMIKMADFTVEISKFYKTDVCLDANGSYYGFAVNEILNTAEGREWFPKGIEKDPDGIIWVSAQYVKVSALH